MWGNRTCWTDMLMAILITLKLFAKVRKNLTMSIKMIKWFFRKFSNLSLKPCSFVLSANILKRVRLDYDTIVTLLMWDISVSRSFLAKGNVLVVYDITQRRSFEKAKELVDEFAQWAGPGAFVALVGNKVDLESRREVSFRVSNVAMFI